MAVTWVLAYQIVIGFMWGVTEPETGRLTLPTQEVCETVRDGLQRLPPLADGMLVIEPCRERSIASRDDPAPGAGAPRGEPGSRREGRQR